MDEFLKDIAPYFSHKQITYVDVGAYVGETYSAVLGSKLKVHEALLVEPNPGSIKQLSQNLAALTKKPKKFDVRNIVLGSEPSWARLRLAGGMTRVVSKSDRSATNVASDDYVEVEVTTLDELARELSREHIHLLKVDVEGSEANVFEGARCLLDRRSIDVIYVEAGLDENNSQQCYYRTIEDILKEYGYRVFRWYEQTNEWIDDDPTLRRVNIAFMSDRFAASNPFKVTQELYQARRDLKGQVGKLDAANDTIVQLREELGVKADQEATIVELTKRIEELTRSRSELQIRHNHAAEEMKVIARVAEDAKAAAMRSEADAKAAAAHAATDLEAEISRSAALQAAIDDIQRRNRDLSSAAQKLIRDRKELLNHCLVLEKNYKSVLSSTSWKMLGPIREIMRRLRTFRTGRKPKRNKIPSRPRLTGPSTLPREQSKIVAQSDGSRVRVPVVSIPISPTSRLSTSIETVAQTVYDKLPARAKAMLPQGAVRAIKAKIGSGSPSVKKLDDKLWGGFSTSAVCELASISKDENFPAKDRAEALYSLARWQAVMGDYASALNLMSQRRTVYPKAAGLKRQFILEGLFLCRLGRADDARNLLEPHLNSPSVEPAVDLLMANTHNRSVVGEEGAYSDHDVLACINRLYDRHGIEGIEKIAPEMPLSLDNIKGIEGIATSGAREKVTVIVPAFNAAETIITALRSLAQQTHRNLEVLIVNDCSTDETEQVAAAFCANDSRFRLIRSSANCGSYACRNLALADASGDYVTLLDADDWAHPQKIELQLAEASISNSPYNYVMWTRCTTDLAFLGNFRPGPDFVFPDHSSGFFRLQTLKDAGGWDAIRVAGDTELFARLDDCDDPAAKFKERHILKGCPLSFGRTSATSLTRMSQTNALTIFHGIRREYRESFNFWRNQGFPAYENRTSLFPSPLTIASDSKADRPLDVVFIADWNLAGGTSKSALNMLAAALRAGMRCGIFHYRRYDLNVTLPLNLEVREYAWENDVRIVAAGESVTTGAVVVTYPAPFNHLMDSFPKFNTERLFVVVNQMAERDTQRQDVAYDPARVRSHLKTYFGTEGRWVPISNWVRRVMEEDDRYPRPHHDNWTPMVDLTIWSNGRPYWRGMDRRRPIVGRHGRDHYLKWPANESDLAAAYCLGRECDVHFLGGAQHALDMLSEKPKNWHIEAFGARDVQEFLKNLDFFVHYPHKDYIEEFGRAPMEAMAVGVPVILPPVFEATFGDAAIYAEPKDVWPIVSELWSNERAWSYRVEIGRRYVERNCSYSEFPRRIAN